MGNPDDHGPARPGLRPDGAVDGGLVDADLEWAAVRGVGGPGGRRRPRPRARSRGSVDEWEPWDPELDDPGRGPACAASVYRLRPLACRLTARCGRCSPRTARGT